MTQYKMMVLDIDNTLTNSDNKLSVETKSYLLDIQKRGYYVVLASGRPAEGMLPIARGLESDRYNSFVISYSGSETIDTTNESVEVDQPVSKEDFDNIVDYCKDKNFLVLTYDNGYIIHDSSHEYMNIESQLTGLPMNRVADLKKYINHSMPKITGVDYVGRIAEACIELDGYFDNDIDVTTGKPFFLEFMAEDISRGSAIEALCKKLQIPLEEVIVFGDNLNDKSVFKVVGYSVAIGNASDKLKKIAGKITSGNNSNGISCALKGLLV